MIDLVQYRTSIGLFASVTSRSSKKRNPKLSVKTLKNSSKPTAKIKTTTKDEDVTRGRSFICLQLLTVVLYLHVACSNQFLDTNAELLKHSDVCDSRCTGTEILHCNVYAYGSVECWGILHYEDVGSYNNNMSAVNYSDTLSYSDVSFKNRHHVKYNNQTIDFNGNRSEHRVLLPCDSCVEHSYFICQSICNGPVIIQSLEMCPYPGTCCYLLGNKGMHSYNGNPPTGLNLTEEAIKKQRLCVLLVDGGSQALRYTISRIVLDMKLQNVDVQTRCQLCVNDKSLLYPAGSVLPSLDALTQAGLDMVWTKALQQSPVTSATAQNIKDMIYNYLVSEGLDIQLKNNKQRVQELNNEKQLLSKEQWDILYPRLNATVDLESFDITLLCFVILHVFQFKPTSGIWSQDPPAGDVGVGDDILRLRTWRNKLTPSSSSGIDNGTFKTTWTEIRDILLRLKPGQEFSDKIQHLHDCQVDPGNAAKNDQLIEDWISHDTQLGKVESDMSQIQECLTETRKDVKRKGKRAAKSTSTTGEPFSRIEKSIPTNELNALHHAQYSVGLISIMDSTQKIVTSTGTGFVVGDGHLMTACHVIRHQIENILATITQIVQSEDSVFERWKTHFLGLEEMEPYAAVTKGYYEKSETNLDVLISSFKGYVTEEDYLQLKEVLNKKWKEEVTVEFENENKNEPAHKYMFSPNIPFLNENIDVAILKIQSYPGCKLPKSLPLTDSAIHPEKVNIFGYIKKIRIELALDPKCEVYTKSSNLAKNVREAINWWKEQEQEVDNRSEVMYDKIDFEGEYKDCVIKDGEVLLHASPSFVHGTSGSPMIEFKEDGTTKHPVVVGIYLRGYPMFYYKIKKAIENRNRLTGDCRHFNKFRELVRQNEEADESDKIIKMSYFIEGGTTMKHLADSLPVSAMRDMLFPNRRTEGAAQNLEDRPRSILNTVEALRRENIYLTKGVEAVVTCLYNDPLFVYNDPLVVFNDGTREFIRDRVRLKKDEQQHDPYVIVYSDDTNIERLADRLLRDYMSDRETGVEYRHWTWTGAKFMIENPNIDDDRLISRLRSKLSDRAQTDKTLINDLFIQCMDTVRYNSYTYKHGDVTQYKLIQTCLQVADVDCNQYIDGLWYPLEISVMTGSLQLTQLLLHHGADKRRVKWYGARSVLHRVCKFTKYNRVELVKLLVQGDLSVVDEEGRTIHDNILTYVDYYGRNILHYSVDDYDLTKHLLTYPSLQKDIHKCDKDNRTSCWYIINNKKPHWSVGTEDIVIKKKQDMIQLYKKHGATV